MPVHFWMDTSLQAKLCSKEDVKLILTQSMEQFVKENNSIYQIFSGLNLKDKCPIDLTIGNPNVKPPKEYYAIFEDVIKEIKKSDKNEHGYLSANGYRNLRSRIKEKLSSKFSAEFDSDHILMTVGATNAIDVVLKTVIEPPIQFDQNYRPFLSSGVSAGNHKNNLRLDEIIIIAPYFIEYVNLIKNNLGIPVVVPSDNNFDINIAAIKENINRKTKAIIINSPNNPTGKIYSETKIKALASALRSKNEELDICICVIEDHVYDNIVCSGKSVCSIIPYYDNVFYINSYSKSLSLAGDRLGYIAVHPFFKGAKWRTLLSCMSLNIRAKVVNAPHFQQRVISRLDPDLTVGIRQYADRINYFAAALKELNFQFTKPEGAFYFWVKLPDSFRSEKEFRHFAFRGNDPLLYLPGEMFGGKKYNRYIRLSISTSDHEISRAIEKLKRIENYSQPERRMAVST